MTRFFIYCALGLAIITAQAQPAAADESRCARRQTLAPRLLWNMPLRKPSSNNLILNTAVAAIAEIDLLGFKERNRISLPRKSYARALK
jgi:hypothetical protein